MATHTGLSQRAEPNNNTVIVVVAIIGGIIVLLASIVLTFIAVRRCSRHSHQASYRGPVPPMASYSHKPNTSTSSSFLPDMSSDWHRPSSSPLPSHKHTESDTSTQSLLPPETSNGYRPLHYVQASYNHTTPAVYARPLLPEMNSEWGYSSHYLTHSRITSDSSSKPLLREMNNGWDHVERPVPIHRTTEEDILSNNPTGQYRVPVSRPASRGSNHTPASSSFCLARSDNPYLSHRPEPPALPPLIIPQKSADKFIPPELSPTAAEEQSPASCTSSGSSAYSQTTAHSPLHSIYLPAPSNGVISSELEPQEDGGDTPLVGTLLRARAERNPGGLVRAITQVSHIERAGSIKSIGQSDQSYPRRYRAKRSGRVEDSDTLGEASDRGSVQGPS